MNCQYDHNCKRRATHLMLTKIGDFQVCGEHAKIAEQEKGVRYVGPLNKNESSTLRAIEYLSGY